jgi:hypothetical protein
MPASYAGRQQQTFDYYSALDFFQGDSWSLSWRLWLKQRQIALVVRHQLSVGICALETGKTAEVKGDFIADDNERSQNKSTPCAWRAQGVVIENSVAEASRPSTLWSGSKWRG